MINIYDRKKRAAEFSAARQLAEKGAYLEKKRSPAC